MKCIILGSGLSGLACAISLNRRGIQPLLLEANPYVGGRVSTLNLPNGFRVDRGFQVLMNSYPELSHFVRKEDLQLRQFGSGALIFNGKDMDLLANPIIHPESVWSGFSNDLLSFSDKALVLKLIAQSQFHRSDFPLGSKTANEFLKEYGFSSQFIEMFWRPFLTGVSLDPDLQMGSNYFQFLIRCFSLGGVSLPRGGMQALPELMSLQLPAESIRKNTRVRSFTHDQVTLENGEVLLADQLVCAFDPDLNNLENSPSNYKSVTTIYYSAPELRSLNWNKWLILVPQNLGYAINHMALISAVSPEYALNGRSLLSVNVVGDKKFSSEQITQEIETIAGRSLDLEWVASTEVKKALPASEGLPAGFKEVDQVIFCGDRWTSPSINGALRSGRLAGEYISKKWKSRSSERDTQTLSNY